MIGPLDENIHFCVTACTYLPLNVSDFYSVYFVFQPKLPGREQ